jgi:anti-sigma regulatory factor (Ser/Thr protein kinase)
MPESVELPSLDLPCDRHAPGAVRHALREIEPFAPFLEDGTLVASELVSNAVVHSGCGAGQRIRARANLSRDRMLISVHDPGLSGRDAGPGRPTGSGNRGRGLQIVDQLAHRWGTGRPDGYWVWAELARAA